MFHFKNYLSFNCDKKKLRGVLTQNSSTNIIFYGLLIKKKNNFEIWIAYTDL